jgi:hypothetical protein
MMTRVFVVLMLAVGIGNHLFAQQKDSAVKVDNLVVVTMTGDVAREYARRTESLGANDSSKGLEIQTVASIAQRFDDGRIRIEHSSGIKTDGKTTRLVTLTATVDPSKVVTTVTSKGTMLYASPGAKPFPTTEETKGLEITLSDLKGLKLRTWILSDEIGE